MNGRCRRAAGAMLAVLSALCHMPSAALANTSNVVAFDSEYGMILLDSMNSRVAFDLFERLNVNAENRVLSQVKILAPPDGLFRIACSGTSANYACAILVYPSAFAKLDFDTDRIELTLPKEIAERYRGYFHDAENGYHFDDGTGRVSFDWTPDGLRILAVKPEAATH